MSLSKQIKDLERSIAERIHIISTKQTEAQTISKSLQDARQEAQTVLQEWQNKIDGITVDLNKIVQVININHEAKIHEEGRLSAIQEMFAQSGEEKNDTV